LFFYYIANFDRNIRNNKSTDKAPLLIGQKQRDKTMVINSDINILGGLPDWNLINVFLDENIKSIQSKGGFHSFTAIKTDKSVKRFEKAITGTLLHFGNVEIEKLFLNLIRNESLSSNTLLFLFWNASCNNDLFNYLNKTVFFPAYYSGRITIKKSEVEASINELKSSETELGNWTEETIKTVARKYLTLLKKFGLMDGSVNKSILYPYLDDKMFVTYIYWFLAVSKAGNLINSPWLQYSFTEKPLFIERLLQKRFSKFYNVVYTGDRLNIETIIPYEQIYSDVIKS